VSRPWIVMGERSGSLTRIATTKSVSLYTRRKVDGFLKLESATRGISQFHAPMHC